MSSFCQGGTIIGSCTIAVVALVSVVVALHVAETSASTSLDFVPLSSPFALPASNGSRYSLSDVGFAAAAELGGAAVKPAFCSSSGTGSSDQELLGFALRNVHPVSAAKVYCGLCYILSCIQEENVSVAGCFSSLASVMVQVTRIATTTADLATSGEAGDAPIFFMDEFGWVQLTGAPRGRLHMTATPVACTSATPTVPYRPPPFLYPDSAFVRPNGTAFTLHGRPYRFVGTNDFELAALSRNLVYATMQVHASHGVQVIRLWAFSNGVPGSGWGPPAQPVPCRYNRGSVARLDAITAAAQYFGIKLILTLANWEPNLGGAQWYVDQILGGRSAPFDPTHSAACDAPDYLRSPPPPRPHRPPPPVAIISLEPPVLHMGSPGPAPAPAPAPETAARRRLRGTVNSGTLNGRPPPPARSGLPSQCVSGGTPPGQHPSNPAPPAPSPPIGHCCHPDQMRSVTPCGDAGSAFAEGECHDREMFYWHPRVKQAYRAWAALLVSRVNEWTGRPLREEPAVVSWELMNEAHTRNLFERDRGLNPGGLASTWIAEMAAYLRSIAPRTMVSSGEEGYRTDGVCGCSTFCWLNCGLKGGNVTATASSPHVSFVTIHVYPDNWGITCSQGLAFFHEFVSDRVAIAHRHRKPLVIEEMGAVIGYLPMQSFLSSAFQSARDLGSAGELLWQMRAVQPINAVGRYDIGYGDDGAEAFLAAIQASRAFSK